MRGARVSEIFFTKNPNLKYFFFFWGGGEGPVGGSGWGGGQWVKGGGRVSECFLQRIRI